MTRIYLDNNASTAIDPIVLEYVIKVLQEDIGNPSSIHSEGQRGRKIINQAREQIASYVKQKPQEIIFTSGGSEGAAFLIHGFIEKEPEGHIITSVVEHPCVYKPLQILQRKGRDITFLPTGLRGGVTPEQVKEAIKPNTKLIMLMAVNNETGVKNDIEAIAKIAQTADIPLFVDGVSWLGKEKISIPDGVTAAFFSGHKIHAPKGIGFVLLRNSLKLTPIIGGGNQEYNRRAGTENVAGIAGLFKAIELLEKNQISYSQHMQQMRDKLEKGLMNALEGVKINGHGPRVYNTTNLSFSGVDGETLLIMMDKEIAISHGSACSSGALEPSRILLEMGIPLSEARTAIRFSTSRFTTEQEIDRCIELTSKLVTQLRR